MKSKFIINLILIGLSMLAAYVAAKSGMWFCTAGSVLFLLFVVYKQLQLFDRCSDSLRAEKALSNEASSKAVAGERELHFYRLLMDKVDTAVIVAADGGYIEWMNRAARQIQSGSESLCSELRGVMNDGVSELRIREKMYSASYSRVMIRNSSLNIIALKDIDGAIERNKVESWHKLVRVLTHEIMNSMTPIISLSEILRSQADSTSFATDSDSVESVRHGLEIINRRSSGLLHFVENYRKLTRISPPEITIFTVREFVDGLKALFTQSYITFDTDAVCDVKINGDRVQLEQVVINLMKNAMEACDEKAAAVSDGTLYNRSVTFSVAKEYSADGRLLIAISVADNGAGIDDTALEQIFVPFFTTKKRGSGIGLSLCKQIITNHHGSISVVTTEGGGCTVVCKIPVTG